MPTDEVVHNEEYWDSELENSPTYHFEGAKRLPDGSWLRSRGWVKGNECGI